MQKKLHFIIYSLILSAFSSTQASQENLNCCYFVCGTITGASIILLATSENEQQIVPTKRNEWLEKTLNEKTKENQELKAQVMELNFNLKHREKQLAQLQTQHGIKTVRFELSNEESKKDK